MKNYINIIRKQDFADLYKYGVLYLNTNAVEFSGSVEELRANSTICKQLLSKANQFDNSFVYLFIHYTTNSATHNKVKIENVQHIFPIDNSAKNNFETTLGTNIAIEEPLWTNFVNEWQKKQMLNDCKKGIKNIWKLTNCTPKEYKQCKKIISDELLYNVIDMFFDNKQPCGDISIWEYLLMYERHEYYPHTSVGYFMDAFHVMINKMAKSEQLSYEQTNIYKFLASLNQSLNSSEIRHQLNTSEHTTQALNMVKEFAPEIDYLNVATCFFFLKEKYSEDFVLEEDLLVPLKRHFPNEFCLSLFFLGFVLGHNKTHNALYANLPLHIYKPTPQKETPTITPTPIVTSTPTQKRTRGNKKTQTKTTKTKTSKSTNKKKKQ